MWYNTSLPQPSDELLTKKLSPLIFLSIQCFPQQQHLLVEGPSSGLLHHHPLRHRLSPIQHPNLPTLKLSNEKRTSFSHYNCLHIFQNTLTLERLCILSTMKMCSVLCSILLTDIILRLFNIGLESL